MTRNTAPTRLTEIDMMMLRAGGRTEAEFEQMARAGFGLDLPRRACGALADALYAVVLRLEAGARRGAASSHLRRRAA